MSITKQFKDYLIKFCWHGKTVPIGLFELSQYFRNQGPIEFEYKKEGNKIIAISKNFRHGSIITSANNEADLDKNIKDAILTSFEIPSSYMKETGLYKMGSEEIAYAIA